MVSFIIFLFFLERFDLFKGNRTLTIYPFTINVVLLMQINDIDYALKFSVCDETKTSWFLGSFISHDNAIVNGSESLEILTEVLFIKIMRQATNEDFLILRVDPINLGLL